MTRRRSIDRARRAIVALVISGVAVAGAVVGADATAQAEGSRRAAVAAPATPAAAGQDAPGLPDPEASPDRARQEARDILSRPEYQEPPKTWADSVKEWLGERLGDLFRNVNGGAGGPIMWVILAVLVGALLFFLFRIRGGFRWREKQVEDPLFVTELEAARSPVEWLSEAERLEASGEWKQALRCRYRALLGHLIDEGIVRDIPGRTSGEFRVETSRRAPHVAASFSAASALFDAAWYGDVRTGQAENARFRQLAAEVTEQARRADKDDRDDEDRNQPLRVTVGSE
jgi:hypothetical protein